MIDRIKQVIEYSQLSSSAFAETIGISRSRMTHLFTGRNQPSLDVARKVLAKFPEISTEWLIMGMGEMLRPDEQPVDTSVKSETETPSNEYPVENLIIDRQTDLFGEFENPVNSEADVNSANEAVANEIEDTVDTAETAETNEDPLPAMAESPTHIQPAQVRIRKSSEPKSSPAPAKRDRRAAVGAQERKLQKIIFFYDDHSFEIYNNC